MAIVDLILRGHLTTEALDAALDSISTAMTAAGDDARVLVSCVEMTGYDLDARASFVAWNRQHKAVLRRVAIVTNNRLWHVVVSAMALASSTAMRAFESTADARAWLGD